MNDTVRTLLDAAHLPASPAEITAYAAEFADRRSAVDALYAVPEARYAVPALHFRAAFRTTDWAS